MGKPKPKLKPKDQKSEVSTPGNWLDVITDDRLKLAIPIGPRFQADIPDWTGPPRKCSSANDESDALKWLGTRVWPHEGRSSVTKRCVMGKGRPNSCSCASPGSIGCVKRHITEKRVQLQFDLGPAFWKWRFNDIGEDVSKTWNLDEQKKFESLVKRNPVLQGKSFLNPAVESLPKHSREDIVNYYFNVYVPRRMSIQTRAGCKDVDTDDDEASEAPGSKTSRKRLRADGATSSSSKYLKDRYLTGRR